MTLSIAQKLVAAIVGVTLLVVAATLGLARWSFEQGFLDYVNALEHTRLERVRTELVEGYLAAGRNWDFLGDDALLLMLRRSLPRGSVDGPAPRLPPPPIADEEMPPPAGAPGRQRMLEQGFPPTALYDAQGARIAGLDVGTDGAPVTRIPIVVDGRTIAELRSEPRRRLVSSLETEFSRQQLQTSWLLGAMSLVLALTVSLLLARGLLAPVRRMMDAVAQLSAGNYAHRMNESRGDELGVLTRNVDRLGATLEANQSSRKRLLADISHELRTPLTVLAGEIEALKDGVRDFDARQLGSLDQEVQRLRYLVDDLYQLSISDVGGLRYTFADVNVGTCAREAVAAVSPRASALGIELVLVARDDVDGGTPLVVTADTRRLQQLLHNLLENSLAYTDAPGRVVVKLSRTGSIAVITIDDTAPGVGEGDCEKLFDPLYRPEESRSRRYGGAGLGLAICKNIVAAHGGNIVAAPSPLGGLTMRTEIPLAREGDS